MLHTTNANGKYDNTTDNNIGEKNYKTVMKKLVNSSSKKLKM